MKPSKKQNNAGLNKKEKIETYFKSAAKTFAIHDKPIKECDATKMIYVQALKERIQALAYEKQEVNAEFVTEGEDGTNDNLNQQVDGACAVVLEKEVIKDINSKKTQISNIDSDSTECTGCTGYAIAIKEGEMKYKELKARYLKLAVHSSERDLKYNDLLNAVISTDQPDVDDVATFSDDIFTKNQIKVLQSMSLDKKSGSSFILKCLEFAYKTDPSVLCFKTLKGKPEWVEISEDGEETHHAGKAPLTPKKVERIRQVFIERVSQCKIDSVAYGDRMKESYVNKLFAWGVTNISKRQ